jgi:hypothetical protein
MMRGLVAFAAAALAVWSAAAEEPAPNSLFLDGDIGVEVHPDGDLTVSWRTLQPAPPGVVFLGLVAADEDMAFPIYRFAVREAGDTETLTTAHSASFELSQLETPLNDIARLRENHGGTVYLRLQVYDQNARTMRLFHSRMAYQKREDGSYRRIPCIVLGPNVDRVTPDSAIISWETDLAVSCNLGHRVPGGPMTTEIRLGDIPQGPGPHRWEWDLHELPAASDITYFVQMEDPENGSPLPSSSPERSFRTAPATGSSRPFHFAVMSDSRAAGGGDPLTNVENVNWRALQRLMPEAYRQGAEFILFAGDLVSGYTSSRADFVRQLHSWRQVTDPVAALVPIYEGMGNHESLGPAGESGRLTRSYTGANAPEVVFSEQFVNPTNGPPPEAPGAPPYGETVYSFDWGNAHFTSLNANYWWKSGASEEPGNPLGHLMEGQMQWLEQDLASARERGQEHLFVYFHTPVFPNGGHIRDSMWYGGASPDVIAMRDRFLSICSSQEVLAVFAGHEHNYSRMLIDHSLVDAVQHPIWQIVSGGAGAPYYGQEQTPWTDRVEAFSVQSHFVLVDVDGDAVTLKAISIDGQVIDSCPLTERIREREDMPEAVAAAR